MKKVTRNIPNNKNAKLCLSELVVGNWCLLESITPFSLKNGTVKTI
jgi:hypothetical protein